MKTKGAVEELGTIAATINQISSISTTIAGVAETAQSTVTAKFHYNQLRLQ